MSTPTLSKETQFNFTASDPLEVMRQVELAPRLVEDYRPLPESLEWRLSQNHWRSTGTASFLRSEVPYTITSSGTLSAQAARVLHANLLEAPPHGPIPVLETGAGTGMFARLFLEEFERLCSNSGHDFYSRIVYHVTDGSRESVEQWKHLGVFEGKPVILGTAQGSDPVLIDTGSGTVRLSAVRAVFANYVIDSMGSAVLRKSADGPEELHIRTHLSEEAASNGDATVEEVRRMVSETDARLLGMLDQLEFEAAFLPVSRDYPYLDEALTFGHEWPRVMLNYGAFEYLEGVLAKLDPDGCILVNDYGMTQPSESAGLGSIQRFGPTAAMGINFPLLAHHFSTRDAKTSRPALDERLPLHPILISHRKMRLTEETFQQTFSWETFREMNTLTEEARKHVEGGRLERAGRMYEQGLRARPRDWTLMGEIAEFLLRRVGDYDAGRKMAESALSMNPWYSVWLWNLYGDALYALERFDEAHAVYLKAEKLSSNDVRTALNLGYTYLQQGRPEQALAAIARGLAEDGSGQFRERLLQKQGEILAKLSEQYGRKQEWLSQRAARMAAE